MRRHAAVLVGLFLFADAARAHRIDEYLQATIVSLQAGRAQASMRLIPGMAVAPSVIAAIDTDHDGVFSESEMQAYARRVLADLSIAVDGRAVPAQLDSWRFAAPAELRDGMGEITLQYHVDLAAGGGPDRRLVLVNHHLNAGSVYLMNAEVPADRRIRITDQKRNQQQSSYELDFEEANGSATAAGATGGVGWGLRRLLILLLFGAPLLVLVWFAALRRRLRLRV